MNKILAIIVTYNRLADLKNCLDAIKCQTFKDFDTIVVNNGSTDGTKEYLDSLSDILVINQDNLGGAGGFYAGQKYAMDNDYEWIWMMDDDGLPEKDQLKNLINYADRTNDKFLNAMVIDKDDHSRFSFFAHNWTVEKALQQDAITEFIHPFNGTFINREIMQKAGLIKREMFIWGDELELTMRYAQAGYRPVTVTSAIHYHPKEKGNSDTVLPGLVNQQILVKPKKMSKYYFRNQGYIHQTYYRTKWYKGLKPMFYFFIYYSKKLDFKEALKSAKYYIRGLHNDYS